MSDKIYKILNNTKQEISNADIKPLNDSEVSEIMEKFRNEINKDNASKKIKIKKSVIIAASAAAIAIFGGTAVAAGYMNVFDRQEHKNEMTFIHTVPDSTETMELPLDKFADKYDFSKIAKAAQDVPEIMSAETDNFKIQVDSIYCDGTTLLMGVSGSLKDGNPLHKQLIDLGNLKVKIGENAYDVLYGGESNGFAKVDGSLVLDEGTENCFSGSIQVVVFGDKAITKPETVEVSIRRITASENYMDNDYIELGQNITLSANVKPDESLKSRSAYTVTDGEYSVRFYEISPAMMIVGFKSNAVINHAWLNDENGNQLENIGLRELPDYNDGFEIGCMVPKTSGYVTAVFRGEDKESVIKEVRIDMDKVFENLRG